MSFLVRLPEGLYPKNALDGFSQPEFSIVSARGGIWLSQLAYENDDAKRDRILGQWGLHCILAFDRQFVSLLPISGTRGFIAQGQERLKNTLFVVFAGTDPLVAANWATDFAFLPTADGIHHGFQAAIDAVWSDIRPVISSANSADVIVSGHSLGAALAILCARRIEEERCARVAAVYTYGQPRIADSKFVQKFKTLGQRTYRLVHGDDIVPTVPPSELGFRHVGRLLQCERRGKFDALLLAHDGSGDLPAFKPALMKGLHSGLADLIGNEEPQTRTDLLGKAFRFLPPPIRDHLPDQYWQALTSE